MPVNQQPDTKLAWFKSSYSGGNETECVECSSHDNVTLVRDSKCPTAAVMVVSRDAWAAFLVGVEGEARAPR